MAMMQQVKTNDFTAQVLQSELPVLVDFWAEWCGPCKMLAPVLESMEPDIAGKVRIVKLNVDDSPDLAVKYGVTTIPTLILFEQGEEKNRLIGLRSKKELMDAFGF